MAGDYILQLLSPRYLNDPEAEEFLDKMLSRMSAERRLKGLPIDLHSAPMSDIIRIPAPSTSTCWVLLGSEGALTDATEPPDRHERAPMRVGDLHDSERPQVLTLGAGLFD